MKRLLLAALFTTISLTAQECPNPCDDTSAWADMGPWGRVRCCPLPEGCEGDECVPPFGYAPYGGPGPACAACGPYRQYGDNTMGGLYAPSNRPYRYPYRSGACGAGCNCRGYDGPYPYCNANLCNINGCYPYEIGFENSCQGPWESYGSNCCWMFRPPFRGYVGFRLSHLDQRQHFTETENQDFFLDRDATLYGVQAGVYYRRNGRIFGQLDGYYDEGSPGSAATDLQRRHWRRYNAVGRLGFTLGWGGNCAFFCTAYSGYGFRWFEDRLRENEELPDTRFIYSYYYVPVGLISTFAWSTCFEISLLAEWDPTVQPLLKIMVDGELDSIVEQRRYRLGNRDAWLIELPVTLKFGPTCFMQVDGSIVPYYQEERFNRCDVTDVFGIDPEEIPSQRLRSFGVRFEIGIRI